MADTNFDVLIIGAGPAGYLAAIRAGSLGLKTAIIEGREGGALGGTCLNVGCIPSKALLDSSRRYNDAAHHFADHGISHKDLKIDVKKMQERKAGVVKQLTGGVSYLMKKNKVTVINGWAEFADSKTVKVGKDSYTAKHIIIASGSVPVELPFAKFDGKTIVDSTGALDFTNVPKKMIVIGAGVIGLELGSVWSRLGADVTLVDMAELPVAIMDKDLATAAKKVFTEQGLKFELGVKVKDVKADKAGATITIEKDGKDEKLSADVVLVAVGRKPNLSGLKLEKAGVKLNERGQVQTDKHYKTSVAGIYAIGDCITGPMLAHKGEEEGVACAEMIAGQAGHVNYACIPWVVYTEPEIAGVGMTEAEAKDAGHTVNIGKFNFAANGRALAMGETVGFVKIIADKATDKLLGCHIIGVGASDILAEAVAVMEFGGAAEDLARIVHSHPTLSEAVKEAAWAAFNGSALHS